MIESRLWPGSDIAFDGDDEELWEAALQTARRANFKIGDVCKLPEKVVEALAANFSTQSQLAPFVRDHCHITGKFRGAAHSVCNTRLGHRHTPVMFHNARGYDSHFLVQALAEMLDPSSVHFHPPMKKLRLDAIAENSQRLKCLTIGEFRILDSFQHLPASLDSQLKNLSEGDLVSLRDLASDGESLALVRSKLPFPYEWFDGLHRLSEPIPESVDDFRSEVSLGMASQAEIELLTTICAAIGRDFEELLSILADSTDEEIPHALRSDLLTESAKHSASMRLPELRRASSTVLCMRRLEAVKAKFGLQTFGELHDLYLQVDVYGLADVFEAYRAMAMHEYGLDPVGFVSSPAMFWKAMLKKTEARLELLCDVEKYTFVERAKRGGLCMITQRSVEANNEYLEHYDPDAPSTYIRYLDANNLYGWAMSQPLPLRGFAFEDPHDDVERWVAHILESDWMGASGAFFEVTMDYPEEIHDAHYDFPLAPDNIKVEKKLLSPFSCSLLDNYVATKKLVPHLGPRVRYVCHAGTLQLYLQEGMRLRKVHKVLRFEQSTWLKGWIDHNTVLRAAATSEFARDFFKLANNSVFGKSMEDVRNRTVCHLVTTREQFIKRCSQPSFDRVLEFGNAHFRIVLNRRRLTVLDRPIYAGAAVMELAKKNMYEFHYRQFIPKFGRENVRLCMTDTDSLVYFISSGEFQQKMMELLPLMDTSNFPKAHPFFSNTNKKVVGKMKVETGALEIIKFVAAGVKNYAFTCGPGLETKHLKGISKCVQKHLLSFSDWVNTSSQDARITRVPVTRLQAVSHNMYTVSSSKLALRFRDTKRFWAKDGSSLPLGHFRSREPESKDFEFEEFDEEFLQAMAAYRLKFG